MSTQSAFRNWVGVCAVTTDTVLATAAAAAATSVIVATATDITTSSTIVILDGTHTEKRAVTGVTSNTLTVAALTYAHAKGIYVFALPTSGFGPKGYVALKTFKVPDKYDQLYDESRRGSVVDQVGVVQGMRTSEWSMGGDLFPDTFGYAIAGITGTEKYTAGTTAPNVHAFSVKNTGNGQPVKTAWWVYDGVNCRVVVGRVTKVGIKFDPKALVSWTATVTARASGVLATPTKSFSTVPPLAGWRATLTIATTYNRNGLSLDITLSRQETENIPTFTGTQDPLDTFVGALVVTVKGTLVKTGDTQLAKYVAGTEQKWVITLVGPGTAASETAFTIQMSKGNYDEVEPVLQGKAYNTESFSLTAVANASDVGTSGGLAPAKITLKNAVGTGVYL